MTQTATRKQTEIQQPVVNRVRDKSGKTLGYLVKSDSQDCYYQVSYINHQLHCSCPATVESCKHIRAVAEVGAERKAAKEAAAAIAEAQRIVTEQEVEVERADYLALTGQATSDTVEHIEQEAALAASTTPLVIVMAEAQEVMERWYEEATDYEVLATDKVIAAMREAVAEVPSYVERYQDAETRRCYYEMSKESW